MGIAAEHFVVNGAGERVAVLIDIADYLELMDDAEEVESIRAFDAAKSDNDVEAIPYEQAVREINR